jgi:hypothetical protein
MISPIKGAMNELMKKEQAKIGKTYVRSSGGHKSPMLPPIVTNGVEAT